MFNSNEISSAPLVSICIPVYNSEKWLKETLDSALKQTYPNIEVIAIDDGSSDNSPKILEEYKKTFPKKIKVLHQNNKGASSARNYALVNSTGKYIQWLDADDILDRNKINNQIKYIINNNDPLVLHSSRFGIFYKNPEKARFIQNHLWKDLNTKQWLQYHLKYGFYMFPAAWLVSRELTEIAGLWNEELTYNDDGEYFCRIISKSKFIKFHPDSVCYYRKGLYNSLSRSLGKNEKSLLSLNKSINLSCDYLLNIDSSNESKEACICALSYVSNIIKDRLPIEYSQNLKRIGELGGVLLQQKTSLKFKIVEKFLGEKAAFYLKGLLWNFKIKFEEIKDLLK